MTLTTTTALQAAVVAQEIIGVEKTIATLTNAIANNWLIVSVKVIDPAHPEAPVELLSVPLPADVSLSQMNTALTTSNAMLASLETTLAQF